MNRKCRCGFSILAAVLAVMFALFLGLLFWLLHGNEEPERILQGAAGTETLSVSGQASPPENSGQGCSRRRFRTARENGGEQSGCDYRGRRGRGK